MTSPRSQRTTASLVHAYCALAAIVAAGFALAADPLTPTSALEVLADDLLEDLEILAAPAMRGRAAGSAEADLAARFIRLRFRQSGLEPPIQNPDSAPSYFQPVPLQRVRYDATASALKSTSAAGEFSFVSGQDALIELLGPPPADPPPPTDIVFAGWGISAPEYGHDDYAGVDVAGKAVLVWAGEPRTPDGKSYLVNGRISRHALVSTKLAQAEARGATLLIIAESNPTGGFDSSVTRRAHELYRPRIALAGANPTPPVVHLTGAAGAKLLAAAGLDPAPLLASAGFGAPAGQALAGVRCGLDLRGLQREFINDRNVIGVLPGADAQLADAPILVVAHYDHIGPEVAADGSLTVHPGADDNASGVAGLLAIARVLADEQTLPRPVVFAALAAEEEGALGASYLADNLPPSIGAPAAVVNLDMIGRNALDKSSNRDVVMASFTARCSIFMDLLPTAAAPLKLDVRKLPFVRPAGRSDDAPFATKNIPTVFLFTGTHQDHNTPQDTAERILPDKAARVAQLALNVVRALALRTDPLPWDARLETAPAQDPWDRPY